VDTQAEFLGLNLVGQAPAFLEVLDMVKQIAGYDVAVSIYGETGTGKELVARAIHYLGPRASGPLIPVNCGALPDALVENELFGHERGAFTDARNSQQGLIAQADGGMLFLDEIEELSPKAQVALLRFLDDKRYRPLGCETLKAANVRIITASNIAFKDLREAGTLRDDLFFRLNVLAVSLPPLRERSEDIPLLAEHFLSSFRIRYEKPSKFLHASTERSMMNYGWPGNIRELENGLHRAFLLARDDAIFAHDVMPGMDAIDVPATTDMAADLPFNTAKAQAISTFERAYLENLLQRSEGSVTRAARYAHKERRALGKLLKKHGLQAASFSRS
jgi:DNA-binding NtrC family response regulator